MRQSRAGVWGAGRLGACAGALLCTPSSRSAHEQAPARLPQPPPRADLAPLSLGKLTSLAEIEWMQREGAACPALRYYYLGFYIHTCHRMRYKVGAGGRASGRGAYGLSAELLCCAVLCAPAMAALLPPQRPPPQPPPCRAPLPRARATLRRLTCCAPATSAGCRWSVWRARWSRWVWMRGWQGRAGQGRGAGGAGSLSAAQPSPSQVASPATCPQPHPMPSPHNAARHGRNF